MNRTSLIHTRPGLPRRIWWRLQALVLRWKIKAHLSLVDECTRDGIVDSLSLRDFDRQLEAMRAELTQIEGSL